jgi:hypothetical protein
VLPVPTVARPPSPALSLVVPVHDFPAAHFQTYLFWTSWEEFSLIKSVALLLTSISVIFAWVSYDSSKATRHIMRVMINLLAGLPSTTPHQQWERYPDRLGVITGSGLLKKTVVICLDRAPVLRSCAQPTHPRPSSEAGAGSGQHYGSADRLTPQVDRGAAQLTSACPLESEPDSEEKSNEWAESKSEGESDEWISGRLSSVGLEVGSNGNSIYFGRAITLTIAIMSTFADAVPDTKKTTAQFAMGGGCKEGFHRLQLFCGSLFADPASVAQTTELFIDGAVRKGTEDMISAMGYTDADIDFLDQHTHEAVSAIALNLHCEELANILLTRAHRHAHELYLGKLRISQLWHTQKEYVTRHTFLACGFTQTTREHYAELQSAALQQRFLAHLHTPDTAQQMFLLFQR